MARPTEPWEHRTEAIAACRDALHTLTDCALTSVDQDTVSRGLLQAMDVLRWANLREQRNQPARKPAA